MVWNITKDKIFERMTVSPNQAWSVPGPTPPPAPLKSGVPDPMSDAMKAGKWNVDDAQGEMIRAFKEEYNVK
jgi:ribonuclease Z